MSGIVHLVGAGPGAADLLTVRATRLLGEADVVFHDALISREILSLVKARAVPVGKRSGRHSTAQAFINKQLLDAALKHRTVVRLKGGDPMLFGRAQEEIDFLQARGVTVEVVPGVSAAFAASADLGVSLTQRALARSVAFVTPRVAPGAPESSWLAAAVAADTAAIYMAAGEAAGIARALVGGGKPASTPVAVVTDASLPGSMVRFATLESIARSGLPPTPGPALLLLGEVYRARAAADALRGRNASQAA
ncbi:MAG: uroporphyrinogen-III C-methyltransferase [Betaproteobacteria bacterium]|nr:uroporphyrinogen-III C-methyltransferase [Betaproteobacteria bacterium]